MRSGGAMADHSHSHDSHDDTGHSHGHHHGNQRDRGLGAMLRYVRFARTMWRSDLNERVVVELVDPYAGEVVADIGAGVGAATMLAAALGATVLAVEPTPYMRRILGLRRLASRGRRRITIVDGAAEATGIDSGTVDAIWAVNSMHHWTDMAAATVELARILRPGGRIVLIDEDFEDLEHPEYERFAARHHDDGGHAFHMIAAAGIAQQLRAAGLDVSAAGPRHFAGRPVVAVTVGVDD